MAVKKFRVNHVSAGASECLAFLVPSRSLNSAVRKLRKHRQFSLPDGTYYIFEAGLYGNGSVLTIRDGGYRLSEKVC